MFAVKNLDLGGLRDEKFGKVIFMQEESSQDQTSGLKPPIRFSNLDFKWYNEERQPHEAYATSIGKMVSLRCPFSVQDQFGEVCTRNMTFILPEKLGELIEPNLELVKNGNVRMEEQAYRAGYSQEEIDSTIKRLEGAAMAAFSGVGKGADDNVTLHLMLQVIFVYDDYLDNDNKEEFKKYGQLAKIISYFIDVIKGNKPTAEGMNEAAATVAKKHQLLFHMMRKDGIHAASKFGGNPNPFLDDFNEYLASVLVELSLEWNAVRRSYSQMFRRVQRAVRESSCGVLTTLEAYALVDKIYVNESIRQSLLFKNFKLLVAQHVMLVNDMFSYAKEVGNGEASNILYLHHVEEELSMHESLTRIESEVNQISEAIGELGEFLLRVYENDEGLARFIKLGKAETYGHLMWYSYTQRYYQCVTFDMIVH